MKGFFAGSFNPFTIGHLDILARALKVCGSVVLGVGININKATPDAIEAHRARIKALELLFEGIPGVSVCGYETLTAEAAKAAGANILIRSYRNSIDADYERTIADANLRESGIDTILFAARPELAYISSSLVRELRAFHKDTKHLVPTKSDVSRIFGAQ